MSDRFHLQILDVQPKGVKVVGPLTPTMAVDVLQRLMRDQPLGTIGEHGRVYIVDLDTGKITKPTLKLEL
jgi:hypothetical protein